MPKIQSVSVGVARVPLDNVTSFATRTVSARDYCLVKVRSTAGVEGIGFCYAGSTGGSITKVAVEDLLAPALVGEDSLRIEGLWQEMYKTPGLGFRFDEKAVKKYALDKSRTWMVVK